MRFKNAVISSFAYHLPDQVMTSEEIEERLAPLMNGSNCPRTGRTDDRH